MFTSLALCRYLCIAAELVLFAHILLIFVRGLFASISSFEPKAQLWENYSEIFDADSSVESVDELSEIPSPWDIEAQIPENPPPAPVFPPMPYLRLLLPASEPAQRDLPPLSDQKYWTIRRLKEQARRFKIPNYSRKRKAQLLMELNPYIHRAA